MSRLTDITKGFMGGFLGVWGLGMLSSLVHHPILMAPYGATCVLLFAVPHSPLSRPKNVIGGHCLSATIGLIMLFLLGSSLLSMAIGVGLAIALMQLFKVVHPPAGATPLVIIMAGNTHIDFLLFPVLSGCLFLVALASLLNLTYVKWQKTTCSTETIIK
ncbi:HPP family protein [Pseudoalteromonas luteoviolacea]|uniref:HPP family protein n=1 Tax=Pseudoalteromonas luteoviolacea TaxID=43657 RepID=UPI001B3A63FB|nr:HPP family protein [Pseudoalteromonas luteoviolacea]MBQ4879099.1 HPP family protein [Pseudoalteromonas luteoviolacea]MBQ4908146.1 HPP family protein [Pseudoalteromonas luteoviolacea]